MNNENITYGPIDKAAILARRVDSLFDSGAVEPAAAETPVAESPQFVYMTASETLTGTIEDVAHYIDACHYGDFDPITTVMVREGDALRPVQIVTESTPWNEDLWWSTVTVKACVGAEVIAESMFDLDGRA